MWYSRTGHNDNVTHALCMPHNWGYRPNSEYAILISFSPQQWLHERASVLYLHNLLFFFFFAVAKIELGRLVLRSVNCTQLCTYTPEGLLSAIDHHVAEAATYTTHNKHKRRLSMPSAGFEPAIPSTKRLHTHAWKTPWPLVSASVSSYGRKLSEKSRNFCKYIIFFLLRSSVVGAQACQWIMHEFLYLLFVASCGSSHFNDASTGVAAAALNLKPHWLRYVLPDLTFRSSTFCWPHFCDFCGAGEYIRVFDYFYVCICIH